MPGSVNKLHGVLRREGAANTRGHERPESIFRSLEAPVESWTYGFRGTFGATRRTHSTDALAPLAG